jgi:hypothetical protein
MRWYIIEYVSSIVYAIQLLLPNYKLSAFLLSSIPRRKTCA